MYPDVPFDLLSPSLMTIVQVLLPFVMGSYCFISIYKNKSQQRRLLFYLAPALSVIILLTCTLVFFTQLITKFIIYSVLLLEMVLFQLTILSIILRYNEKAKIEYDLANNIRASKWNNFRKTNTLVWYLLITYFIFFQHWGILMVRVNLVADLPAAIQGQYSTLSGHAKSLYRYTDKPDTAKFLIVNEAEKNVIYISTNDFVEPTEGKEYTVTCLPHSHYVIDILDESGKSLLK